MSADIVNLRQARKSKARSAKERQAEQNRISFGRPRQEKSLTGALNEKASRTFEQGRIDKDNGDDRRD